MEKAQNRRDVEEDNREAENTRRWEEKCWRKVAAKQRITSHETEKIADEPENMSKVPTQNYQSGRIICKHVLTKLRLPNVIIIN